MKVGQKYTLILVWGAVLYLVCAVVLELSLWYPRHMAFSIHPVPVMGFLLIIVLGCYYWLNIKFVKVLDASVLIGLSVLVGTVLLAVVAFPVNIILTIVHENNVLRLHYDPPVGAFDLYDLEQTINFPGDECEISFKLSLLTLGGHVGTEGGPSDFVITALTGPSTEELEVGGRLKAVVEPSDWPAVIKIRQPIVAISQSQIPSPSLNAKVRVPSMDTNAPIEITGHLSQVHVTYPEREEFGYIVKETTINTEDATLRLSPGTMRGDVLEARGLFDRIGSFICRLGLWLCYCVGSGLVKSLPIHSGSLTAELRSVNRW